MIKITKDTIYSKAGEENEVFHKQRGQKTHRYIYVQTSHLKIVIYLADLKGFYVEIPGKEGIF